MKIPVRAAPGDCWILFHPAIYFMLMNFIPQPNEFHAATHAEEFYSNCCQKSSRGSVLRESLHVLAIFGCRIDSVAIQKGLSPSA